MAEPYRLNVDPHDSWYHLRIYQGEELIANIPGLRDRDKAEFLVKAANAYDETMAALEAVAEDFDKWEQDMADEYLTDATIERVRLAIANAKAGQ